MEIVYPPTRIPRHFVLPRHRSEPAPVCLEIVPWFLPLNGRSENVKSSETVAETIYEVGQVMGGN